MRAVVSRYLLKRISRRIHHKARLRMILRYLGLPPRLHRFLLVILRKLRISGLQAGDSKFPKNDKKEWADCEAEVGARYLRNTQYAIRNTKYA